MRRIMFAAAAATVLGLGYASAEQYRTVTWFADHPDVMRKVLVVCRDNAALAPQHPNCLNAEEAQATVFLRDANRGEGSNFWQIPNEKFWRDPSNAWLLKTTLTICNNMRANHAALQSMLLNGCYSAWRVASR